VRLAQAVTPICTSGDEPPRGHAPHADPADPDHTLSLFFPVLFSRTVGPTFRLPIRGSPLRDGQRRRVPHRHVAGPAPTQLPKGLREFRKSENRSEVVFDILPHVAKMNQPIWRSHPAEDHVSSTQRLFASNCPGGPANVMI
jgi:hypothetical protein